MGRVESSPFLIDVGRWTIDSWQTLDAQFKDAQDSPKFQTIS